MLGSGYGAGGETVISTNFARTVVARTSLVTQLREPWHPPDQEEKTQPVAGCGTSLTRASVAKCAEHFFGHLMPIGLLVTVPFPDTLTLSSGSAEVERAGAAAARASVEAPRRRAAAQLLAMNETLAPLRTNEKGPSRDKRRRCASPSRSPRSPRAPSTLP